VLGVDVQERCTRPVPRDEIAAYFERRSGRT
jgi:hypothetical protein